MFLHLLGQDWQLGCGCLWRGSRARGLAGRRAVRTTDAGCRSRSAWAGCAAKCIASIVSDPDQLDPHPCWSRGIRAPILCRRPSAGPDQRRRAELGVVRSRSGASASAPTGVRCSPSDADRVLDAVHPVAGRLVAHEMHNATSEVRIYDVDGTLRTEVHLPGPGTVTGIGGEWSGGAVTLGFTSFAQPSTAYHVDLESGGCDVFAQGDLPPGFDAAQLRDAPGVVHLARRHAHFDVRDPPPRRGADRSASDGADRLRRLQRQPDAAVRFGAADVVGRRRRVRAGQLARRWRVRRSLAPRGHARQQAERLRRLSRGGRMADRPGHHQPAIGWRSAAAATAGCWSAPRSPSGRTCSRPSCARCRCWTCCATRTCASPACGFRSTAAPRTLSSSAGCTRIRPYHHVRAGEALPGDVPAHRRRRQSGGPDARAQDGRPSAGGHASGDAPDPAARRDRRRPRPGQAPAANSWRKPPTSGAFSSGSSTSRSESVQPRTVGCALGHRRQHRAAVGGVGRQQHAL